MRIVGSMVTFDDIIWMLSNLSLRQHLNSPSVPSSKFTMERHEIEEYLDIIVSRLGSRPTRHAVPYNEVKWFYVSPTGERNINDYSGNSINITIHSNVDWSIARSGGSWISSSVANGSGDKAITLTWQDNPTDLARYATFIFSTEGRSYTLEMIDEIPDELAYSDITRGWGSGTFYVEVKTSKTWSASSNRTWLTIDPNYTSGAGTTVIPLSVSTNSGATRYGTITVAIDGGPNMELDVKQWSTAEDPDAPTISISPSSKTVDEFGESFSINVTLQGTASWSYTVYDGGGNWLSTSKSGNTLNVSAVRNNGAQRGANIVFSVNGGNSKTFSLTQKAVGTYVPPPDPYLNVTPESSTSLPKSGGEVEFRVNSNARWEIISKPSWITISGADGEGYDGEVFATAGANSGEYRSGTITVGVISGGPSDSFNVSQASGITFSISPTSKSMGSSGGVFGLDITCNTSWSASASGCTIGSSTSASGYGNDILWVDVPPNSGEFTMIASVQVTSGGESKTCLIEVAGSDGGPGGLEPGIE